MDRRRFLALLSTVSLAPVACRRPQTRSAAPLRLLMLGGTSFVGPHLVQTAMRRGHEVTLFNRGRTNPHLFPHLEKLRGDRYPERGQALAALDTGRTWDAVIDTWQDAPGCVDRTAHLLADRTDRYVYISSIATYGSYRTRGLTEDGPLLDASEHAAAFDNALSYPRRKRAAEQVVEQRFGDRAMVLRCPSIVGYDGSGVADRPPGYWVSRFAVEAPVLAPDDPTAVVQFIDVKDMAQFAITAIERRHRGAFNVVGPEEPLPFREHVFAWGDAMDRRSAIVWIDPDFLLAHGVRPFDDIPWIPESDPEPGFYRISNARARAHGLTFRPLDQTIRDEIASFRDYPTTGTSGRLTRKREQELIRQWQEARGS